jgi:type I restriction enzyme M protein
MNLLLHGIGESDGKALIDVRDALLRPPYQREQAPPRRSSRICRPR